MDYAACMKKAYPTDTFELVQDENGLVLTWDRQESPPTLQSLEVHWLAIVKEQSLIEVKDIRRQGLDKAAISAGIYAIYQTNYDAAVDYLNGSPDSIMKNGMTPEAYLAGFGAKLNMTATQFANYIIAENLRVGPALYDIEKRYLALTYAGDLANGIVPINYLTTETAILQAVINFKTYCGV